MEARGNVDLVDAQFLFTLADAVVSLYNSVNTLNPETCDLQFREVRAAIAVLDESAVKLGQAMKSRQLQAKSPEPTAQPSTQPTPALDLTYLIATNSTSPSASPTSQYQDLFTILVQMRGNCRGCSSETTLFDQLENMPEYGSNVNGSDRRSLLPQDGCYCSEGAERGPGPTEASFLEAWKLEEAILGDDLPCIDTVNTIEEIRIIDCNTTEVNFLTYLEALFVGDFMALTEDEILKIEEAILALFQDLASQVCDVYSRLLLSVRTIRRGLIADVVSTSPSETPTQAQPSAEPSLEPSNVNRKLQENGSSGTPSGSPRPSFRPTTLAPTIMSPIEIPQNLFRLVFELTASCEGCHRDLGLFDQVLPRQLLSLTDRQFPSYITRKRVGARRLESEGGKCGCGLGTPDGGVLEEEFELNLAEIVSELDLPNVESLEQASELFDLPSETPSESIKPSVAPSFSFEPTAAFPSDRPSSDPSGYPSKLQSESPTDAPVAPSVDPSQQPTSLPTEKSPSSFPSELPSVFPSLKPDPTESPTQTPSKVPSPLPTASPSNKPTIGLF